MRIIITREGTEIVEELENETINDFKKKRYKSVTHNHFNIRSDRNIVRTYRINTNLNSINSSTFYSPKKNKSHLIDNELKIPNQEEIKSATIHNLNIPKISFSKAMAEKYFEDKNPSNIISQNNQIPSFLLNENEDESSSLNSNKNNIRVFSFNEIIPGNSIRKMKMKLIKDQKMRNKLSKVNENNFRSIYQNKSDLVKLDEMLCFPKINSTKIGLIKYLNGSKYINPITIKNLINSDPIRINRMNKMAEILNNEKEQQKLQDNIVQNKLKNLKNEETIFINKQINTMKNQMDDFKEKLDKYKKNINNKERYRDLLNDVILHYWNKHDFNRLNKKNTPKNKYSDSSYLSNISK